MANETPDPTAGQYHFGLPSKQRDTIDVYGNDVVQLTARQAYHHAALVEALRAMVEEYRPQDHWRRVRSGEAKCKGCPTCDARAVLAAVEERHG